MEEGDGYDTHHHMQHQHPIMKHEERPKFSSKGRIKSPPVKSPSPSDELKSEGGYVPPTSNYLTFSEALQQVQRGHGYTTNAKMTHDRPMHTPGGMMVNQYGR